MRSAMVSCRGVSRYSKSSGTGRVRPRTTDTSRPLKVSRFFSIGVVSPSVADIKRKVVSFNVMSGSCQASPRSRSA
jgi:hypothetical protein